MADARKVDLGVAGDFLRASLELGAATAFDFLLTVRQIGEKNHPPALGRQRECPGTGGGRFLTRPAPDGLVSVEVWTVGGQVHQAQVQVGRGQISPDGVTPMGGRIVPDHDQRFVVLRPQLLQEGGGGGGVAVASSSITATSPVSRHTAE